MWDHPWGGRTGVKGKNHEATKVFRRTGDLFGHFGPKIPFQEEIGRIHEPDNQNQTLHQAKQIKKSQISGSQCSG